MSTIYSAYPDLADLIPAEPHLNKLPGAFPHAAYEVHVPWNHLEDTLAHHVKDYGLNLDPDYQRAHVWTKKQQTAYIEYMLLGGELSRTLVFTADHWMSSGDLKRYELTDGKQRLEAVRAFLRSEVYAFRYTFKQYKGTLRFTHHNFGWRVVEVENRADVLKLYLSMNAGGTPHSPKELARVQQLLAAELQGKST